MSPQEEPASPAKLVVDEDWKARAQAEKEALQKAREQSQSQSPPELESKTIAKEEAPAEGNSADEKLVDFPPASFAVLVGEIGMQALMAIEESARSQGVRKRNLLGAAKLTIDNLDVLEEKCRGNLTSEESQLLSRYLQAARLAFVEASSRKT